MCLLVALASGAGGALALPASRVLALPGGVPPGGYDPPLPPGTPTDDVIWLSHLLPEAPLQPLPLGNVFLGGGVQLAGGNASLQRGQWLRLDLHLTGLDTAGAGPVNIAWRTLHPMWLFGATHQGLALDVRRGVATCSWQWGATAAAGGRCSVAVFCGGNTSACVGNVTTGHVGVPSWLPAAGSGEALLVLHARAAPPGPGGTPPTLGGTTAAPTSLICGDDHTCFVNGTGSLACWGLNLERQLGHFGTVAGGDAWLANQGNFTRVAMVDAEQRHSCAVLSDASLWCWGTVPPDTSPQAAPARIMGSAWGSHAGGMPVSAVYVGEDHTCAVLGDGSLWCWGLGSRGQLGIGSIANQHDPVRVMPAEWGSGPGLLGVNTASASWYHSCAVLADGSLWCWGAGQHGTLGVGSEARHTVPVRVQAEDWGSGEGQVSVVQVSTGGQHTCAVLADGSAWCWGQGADGRLGTGNTETKTTPQRLLLLPEGQGAIIIDAGELHTCALLSSGMPWCWGSNSTGQLGGGSGGTTFSATPAAVNTAGWGGKAAVRITTGQFFSCAVLEDGSLWCWGGNDSGQRNGPAPNASPPPAPSALPMIVPGYPGGSSYLHGVAFGRLAPSQLPPPLTALCHGGALPHCQRCHGNRSAVQGSQPPQVTAITAGAVMSSGHWCDKNSSHPPPPWLSPPSPGSSWRRLQSSAAGALAGGWLGDPALQPLLGGMRTYLAATGTVGGGARLHLAAVRSCEGGAGGVAKWQMHPWMSPCAVCDWGSLAVAQGNVSAVGDEGSCDSWGFAAVLLPGNGTEQGGLGIGDGGNCNVHQQANISAAWVILLNGSSPAAYP